MEGNDLLIIGPGQLGSRVATLWKRRFPHAKIALKAHRTDPDREAKWKSLGFVPFEQGGKYSNVVFAAPPTSGSIEDYVDSVKTGLELCTSRFIFTSSGGVYVENQGNVVNETSEVWNDDPDKQRFKGILQAEKLVLEHPGGTVLRLGALYTLIQGAHEVWLTKVKETQSKPKTMINLLHYDDAARSALASLITPKSKQEIFLVSDDQPLNYLEVCQTAKKHDLYADKDVPDFKGNDDKSGKIYDGTKIRSMLQWNPKFKNFEDFIIKDFVGELKIPLLE